MELVPLDEGFLKALASDAPTPGGGGASAYCGALACALASMMARITLQSKKYAGVSEIMEKALDELDELSEDLVKLVDLDARAFIPLSTAYKMPKSTPDEIAARDLAIQSSLIQACDVPLDIMVSCADVVDVCKTVAEHGSTMAISDAGAAVILAKAAMQAASLNVFANIASMTDKELATKYVRKANKVMDDGASVADEVLDCVRASLGIPVLEGNV